MQFVTMTPEERDAWNRQIQSYRQRVVGIRIPQDIGSAQGKAILSQLDDIYGEVRIRFGDVYKQYKQAETLIERVRYKGQANGSNPELRKANGIRAVENLELGSGTIVNLYEIFNALSDQKEDLDAIIDIISKKQSMVITMSGLLKIESNISGH